MNPLTPQTVSAPIEMIPLTISEDLKNYLAFLDYCNKLLEERLREMMITNEQNGQPAPRSQKK